MMFDNFTIIIDIVLAVLGIYLVFIGVKSAKSSEVDPMIYPAEELMKCKDIPGLSKFIMPKTAIFGGVCCVLGVAEYFNDKQIIDFPEAVFYSVFFVALVSYVYFHIKGRKTFIQ